VKPEAEPDQPVPKAQEREEEVEPGVPVVYPFLPTPPPFPVAQTELLLALNPEAADLLEGGEAVAEPAELGLDAAANLEAGLAGEPLEADTPPAGAEGEAAGIHVSVLDGLNNAEDVALPDGLRALRPDAKAQPTQAQDFSSLLRQPEAGSDSATPTPPAESSLTHATEKDRTGPETVIEGTPSSDEGVTGKLPGFTPSRLETLTSASASSDASPTSGVTRDEVPQQVARLSAAMVRELSGDGVKEIRVRLDPPSLGEIRLHVEMDGGEVRIQVVAASPETASMLNDGQSNLRDELARQGLALGDFSAGTESAFNFASQSGFTPRGQEARSGTAPRSGAGDEATEEIIAPRRRSAAGLLDAQA
jgi:hypothetical protein